jgi:hypothetical protein
MLLQWRLAGKTLSTGNGSHTQIEGRNSGRRVPKKTCGSGHRGGYLSTIDLGDTTNFTYTLKSPSGATVSCYLE